MDAGFYRAMDMVRPEFLDKVNYYGKTWWEARECVEDALKNRKKVRAYLNYLI